MKLEELEALAEKATKGPWEVLPCSNGGKLLVRGDKMNKSAQMMPDADPELIAALANHRQEIVNLVKAAKKQAAHRQCEDTWYSCPKSEEGCADERQGSECNCGADDLIAAIAAFEDK